jgi:glycosyltransferase involved in cell wall biosynthesis
MGIPLVVSLQGERTMDATGIYQRSPLFNRLLKRVLAAADQITACSRSTLEDAARFNGEEFGSRARVVYNGIGPEAFAFSPPRQNPRPYILAYGRLVRQKGFHVLLHAFKHAALRDVDLLIAGEGPEREALSRLACSLGLADQAHFIGRAGRPGVQSLLQGALGVVVPSLREPMGIVTLETMAAGKPLLASCVDGIPEVAPVGPGVRHFPPGDAAELSVGLRWLVMEKPQLASESLRERARAFEWPKIVALYKEVYATALQR